MLRIIVLYAAGIWLLCLAYYYAVQGPVERAYLTIRDTADFVGDVQAWLRSESE